MIKRRFSQRALAYGLSAVLALSAVLLSLYLPDTLARLGDGALLRQAHETSRIPLIQAGTRVRAPYFALETRACDLYAMFAPPGAPLTADGERHSRIFYQNEK